MKPHVALILCIALAGCEQPDTPDTRASTQQSPPWMFPTPAPRNPAEEEVVLVPAGSIPPTIIDPANSARLVAAADIPGQQRPGDHAPSQWFEIVRPGNGPVQIGRLYASCACLSIEAPERNVPAGRRALVEVRVVSPPPGAAGAGYMVLATVAVGGNASETVSETMRIRQ